MGVSGGGAFFDPTQNITPAEARAALAKVQGTFDEFWNGYVDLLSKMPHEAFKDLLKNLGDIAPKIGTDAATGGDITHGPTKGFWEDFQAWIDAGMPKEIGEKFTTALASGFAGLGVSGAVFKQIWDNLGVLDAKTKLAARTTSRSPRKSSSTRSAGSSTGGRSPGTSSRGFRATRSARPRRGKDFLIKVSQTTRSRSRTPSRRAART